MDRTRCVCPRCNGAQKMHWKEGQPKAFPHEVGTQVAGPIFKRPRSTSSASGKPPAGLQEYVDWVLARTDLNEGMKRMLIANRRRKEGS